MSFAEQKRTAYYEYLTNPSYFAEEVTYRNADGSTFAMRTHIRTSMRQDLNDQDATIDEVEEINVLMMRDPSATTSSGDTIAGKAKPEIGDAVLRSASMDPDQRWYLFKGTITETTDLKYRLIFERKKRWTQGVST